MRAYELMVILSPEVEDRAVEPSLSKFLEIVTSEGGSIDNVDIWGRRRWHTRSRRSLRVSTQW